MVIKMDLEMIGAMCIAIGILAVGIGAGIFAISTILTHETIIVEGEVVDAEAFDNYMLITMKNGEKYKIAYPGDNIDLTVNSKIIMKLTNYNYFFIDDGIWNKVSITKVPGD